MSKEAMRLSAIFTLAEKIYKEKKVIPWTEAIAEALAEQPAQHEPTKAAELVDALIAKYSDKLFDSVAPHDAAKFEEDCNHIKQTLAEQPAQQDGPINEGWHITVANGHSGYGVYAHMEDYPEEGAVLVQAIEQPAQQQEPVAGDVKDQALTALNRMQSLFMMDDGRHPRDVLRAYIQLTAAPPASKPWVGLTDGERLDAERLADQQYVETRGQELRPSWASLFCRDIEAKLREKNK